MTKQLQLRMFEHFNASFEKLCQKHQENIKRWTELNEHVQKILGEFKELKLTMKEYETVDISNLDINFFPDIKIKLLYKLHLNTEAKREDLLTQVRVLVQIFKYMLTLQPAQTTTPSRRGCLSGKQPRWSCCQRSAGWPRLTSHCVPASPRSTRRLASCRACWPPPPPSSSRAPGCQAGIHTHLSRIHFWISSRIFSCTKILYVCKSLKGI